MADTLYWIWLQQALGAGASQAEDLLAAFPSARAVYEAEAIPDDIPLTRSQRQRLGRKDLKKAQRELERLHEMDAFVITPEDAEYRTLFDGMYAPPVAIYGRGTRFDPCDAIRVTVVGTRYADANSIRATRRIGAGLAAGGAVVISGGADGLDCAAMEAALDEGGTVIAYQACGLDVEYPQVTAPLRERLLQSGGMLLTEFPLGATVRTYHFPIRNRLLAASSFGTVVTAAPKKSGALMTARWARDMGREVFALPGAVGVPCCEGSNALLKEGATLVTNAADILIAYLRYGFATPDFEAIPAAEERAMNESSPTEAAGSVAVLQVAQEPEPTPTRTVKPCPSGVSPAACRLYEALTAREQTAAELALETGLPLSEVLSALTMLELYGTVTCGAGQMYALQTL